MNSLGNKKALHLIMCGILSNTLFGCGAGCETVEPELNQNSTACGIEQEIDLFTGLNALEGYDSISLYHHLDIPYSPFVQYAGGTMCGLDADVEQCNAALYAAAESLEANAVIVTQGEQIAVYSSPESLRSAIGEIDNEKKALLWMHINGMAVSCFLGQSQVSPLEDASAWFGTYLDRDGSGWADRVNIRIDFDGAISEIDRFVRKGACPPSGRIPPGQLTLEQAVESDGLSRGCTSRIGQLFARHAAYEAASVAAFEHLKMELAHYGAPKQILNKIDIAARDEIRHAQQVGALAKRFGATADSFKYEPCGLRSLREIAHDNLMEGCIGETWGALIGLYQADHAQHADVREVMHAIAADEIGHAALSWEIQEWLYSELDEISQKSLEKAKSQALTDLKTKISKTEIQNHQLAAGIPVADVQRVLFEQLDTAIGDAFALVS